MTGDNTEKCLFLLVIPHLFQLMSKMKELVDRACKKSTKDINEVYFPKSLLLIDPRLGEYSQCNLIKLLKLIFTKENLKKYKKQNSIQGKIFESVAKYISKSYGCDISRGPLEQLINKDQKKPDTFTQNRIWNVFTQNLDKICNDLFLNKEELLNKFSNNNDIVSNTPSASPL